MRVVKVESDTMRPPPYRGDQIVLAYHAVAVFHEMDDKIEHLRLDSDEPRAALQLAPLRIKFMIGKEIFHVCALQAGS